MKYSFFLLLALTFLIYSCSSSDDEPNPVPNGEVTYTKTIKSIIDGKCLNCHGSTLANGAPMSLTSLAEVKEAVTNRGLIGRVENGSMPLGGTALTTAQVTAIKNWKNANFP